MLILLFSPSESSLHSSQVLLPQQTCCFNLVVADKVNEFCQTIYKLELRVTHIDFSSFPKLKEPCEICVSHKQSIFAEDDYIYIYIYKFAIYVIRDNP